MPKAKRKTTQAAIIAMAAWPSFSYTQAERLFKKEQRKVMRISFNGSNELRRATTRDLLGIIPGPAGISALNSPSSCGIYSLNVIGVKW
jgi:hypothetical protein